MMKAGKHPLPGSSLSRSRSFSRFSRTSSCVLGAVFLTVFLAGCAHVPPPAPPATIILVPSTLPPAPPADRDVLRGHRIAVDAGHGGVFYGAVGPRGLREAAVNLDVARLLASRLAGSGAEVLLTREDDSDFVGRDSSRLRDDLEARSRKANQFAPEVFLSIHHNADARRDSSRNGLETYYRMTDAGSSFDAAMEMHRLLRERQAPPNAELIPGNYYVLRRSTAGAAVLGEASYLSHPGNEEALLSPERRALEASSYYDALLNYFRGGIPALASMAPDSTRLSQVPPTLTAEIEDGPGGMELDPNSVQAVLDDRPLRGVLVERLQPAAAGSGPDSASWRPGRVRLSAALPADLPCGPHSWYVGARNLNGHSLSQRIGHFVLDAPAVALSVRTIPPDLGTLARSGGDMFEIVVEASDARGLPVEGQAGMVRLGAGWFALPDGDFARDSVGFTLRGGAFHATVRVTPANMRNAEVSASVGRLRAAPVPSSDGGTPWCLVRAKTVRGERTVALPGAAVIWDGLVLGHTDESGFLGVRLPRGHGVVDSLEVAAPGCLKRTYMVFSGGNDYRVDLGSGFSDRGRWPHLCFDQAILPRIPDAALLEGQRVALDPLGPVLTGESVTGDDGVDLNFEVARTLQGYLEAAGAEVTLTRGVADAPTAYSRLQSIEKFGAQRVLLISHAGPPAFFHNPGSAGANAWCRQQSWVWGETGAGKKAPVGEDARYLLRQSSGSAMLAQLGESQPGMTSALGRDRVRREALALYQGIVANSSKPDNLGSLGFRFGTAQARGLARVDGALFVGLDREGRATLPAMAPGIHRIDAEVDGEQMWGLLEIEVGKERHVSDSDLRPYTERFSPSLGLPDAVVHQRYPDEISPRTRTVRLPVQAPIGGR